MKSIVNSNPRTTAKKKPTDETAALLFGLVAILHAEGLLDKLGVSEGLVLQLITWGMTAAALARAWWLRRKPQTVPVPVVDPDASTAVMSTDEVRSVASIPDPLDRDTPPERMP